MATQKKKVHPGLIELDPEDAVVVVNYETHDIEIGSDGTQRVVGRTPGIKQIKIRPLPNERDIPQVAQELTKKCRLISASKVGRVEELLHELVERESMKPGPSSSQSSAAYVHGFKDLSHAVKVNHSGRSCSASAAEAAACHERQQQQQQQAMSGSSSSSSSSDRGLQAQCQHLLTKECMPVPPPMDSSQCC